jgi:hypothetical protein
MQQRAFRTVTLSIALAVFALVPRAAFAQDQPAAQNVSSIELSAKAAIARAMQTPPAQSEGVLSPAQHEFPRFSPTLQSLYVTTAFVQGLDAVSTFKAMDHGAVEANSLVKPFASSRPAFVALKVGMAAAFIYQGHQMSKRHKIGAIITLTVINSVYAAIAMNNYRVIHTMEAQGR